MEKTNMSENKNSVTCDDKGFIINGKRIFIYGGELHYFRIPPSQWWDRLNKCKQAFFNSIGAYMAWNWHEINERQLDFTGERDLQKWLKMIQDLGMYCIARPGPYICSEWNFGGLPNWMATKEVEFRSADERFLQCCRRWFQEVDQILLPFLVTRGGNVYLYQIENEFWWNDLLYHEKLARMVQDDGIDVPLVTNTNGKLPAFGSPFLDSITSYPMPWVVDETTRHLDRLFALQPDMPKMLMELEGGWFTAFGSMMPTTRGYFPPAWTEMYVKTLIAQGVNAMNHYMFHGGTNPEYWAGGGVTTSYDWDASIREWGELSERYYVIRRIGGFLQTFGSALLETKFAPGYCHTNFKPVDLLATRGKNSAFVFPRNNYSSPTRFSMTLKLPATGEELMIPRRGEYQLSGYAMSILPIDVPLAEGITLIYSTSQVFIAFESEQTVHLVLYEAPGFNGELLIEMKNIQQVVGNVEHARLEDQRICFNYVHAEEDFVFTVIGNKVLKVAVTTTQRAGRTWLPVFRDKQLVMLSDIYFLESWEEKGNELRLNAQVKKSDGLAVRLMTNQPPSNISIEGKAVDFTYDAEQGVAAFDRIEFDAPSLELDISKNWKRKIEPLSASIEELTLPDDRPWLEYLPWKSLDEHGFVGNGYFRYKTTFEIDQVSDHLFLSLTGFRKEASVYLNGQFAGTGVETLEADIAPFVKVGNNILEIILETMGHPHSGFKTYNGLISPVCLSLEKRQMEIRTWRRTPLPAYLSEDEFRSNPLEVMADYGDSGWEKIELEEKWDTRLSGSWGDRMSCWYRTRIEIDSAFQEKALLLDFGPATSDTFVYVNGNYVGQSYRDCRCAFDISSFIRFGQANVLAVGMRSRDLLEKFGFQAPVKLLIYDKILNGPWWVKQGLYGQEKDWDEVSCEDGEWETIHEPSEGLHGIHHVVWFRKQVKLNFPPERASEQGFVAPLRITLRGATTKALIYFNGVLIGRYAEQGPQRDFYIYEDIMKETNVVAIAVEGREKGVNLGEVKISPYYVAKKVTVAIIF